MNLSRYRLFLAAAVLILFFSCATTGCGGVSGTATSKGGGFSVSLDARPLTLITGGSVRLFLTVINNSGKTRNLELPSSQIYEFIVYDIDNKEVWRWSDGMYFTQVVTPVTFKPGQAREYSQTWKTAGTEPGEFRVQGYYLALPELKPEVKLVLR